MGLLEGRNAIVTGVSVRAGPGHGRAARRGRRRVVLCDIDAAALEQAQVGLAGRGLEESVVTADVTVRWVLT